MLGKRKNTYSSGRHRILVVSVLCLFGFCLLAQVRPAKKGEQKPAKSKVYLLHSDVLKKSPLNPDPDAQILIGNVAFRHDSVYMYCDSACFYEKTNSLEAFDNVKMVQGISNIDDNIYFIVFISMCLFIFNYRFKSHII